MRCAYGAAEFLSVQEYEHVDRWVTTLSAREPVQRGQMVNRTFPPIEGQLLERHDARDFETNREDLVQARGGTRI